MERRLSSQITPGGQIRMSETPRNPGNEVRMITRLRNQIPGVRGECRALIRSQPPRVGFRERRQNESNTSPKTCPAILPAASGLRAIQA
jgi:hypothetical protein